VHSQRNLIFNFGILFVLKYKNFIILNLEAFLPGKLRTFEWMLPLGISFYTFQSMGYLLDVCWERI
jgi:D-alanyl-lipoteichoic acid acyltransferase DltB (MBOAT superfamily)